MPILGLASRRLAVTTLTARYGADAHFVDVTSRGPTPWVRFSPFYPHGAIPVPLSPGHTAVSVEGIWQGLKVFERADIDLAVMQNATMRGLKRTVARYGPVRGHRAGIAGDHCLPYDEARQAIYLPAYRWVLDHALQPELAQLRRLAADRSVVLLDYETNADPADLRRPLAHAALVLAYLQDAWPQVALAG
ncbi:MAG: hypothetical protein H0X24_06255 [Ktedonobacterales bacterium]|nr:hypothetical protein [Ktedonobacterales bacterium]